MINIFTLFTDNTEQPYQDIDIITEAELENFKKFTGPLSDKIIDSKKQEKIRPKLKFINEYYEFLERNLLKKGE